MELHQNESEATESIKEARAICSQVTLDTKAHCFATVKEAKVICSHVTLEVKALCLILVKEAKTTQACTIQEAKAACSTAVRDAKTWRASRLSYSRGNTAKSCGTWRCKPSQRKAEVKLTSSLPAKLPCKPAQQRSKACW